MKKLRICIDARFGSDSGGIAQFVMGLATAFSNLQGEGEEYLFLTNQESENLLKPYINGPCKILRMPSEIRKIKKLIKQNVPTIRACYNNLKTIGKGRFLKIPHSNGLIEKKQVHVMHFSNSFGFVTNVPSIYHPHDLQHIHFPEFFQKNEIIQREIFYRKFCQQAEMVVVSSEWGKQDLVKQYKLAPDKIKIIPLAPITEIYKNPSDEDLAKIKRKFSLPGQFIFYPAQTWPHKNHLGLLEALKILRDEYKIKINFVGSGYLNKFFDVIRKRLYELKLEQQVKFLGFVDPLELKCLYKLSTCLIIPTKFEASSFPIWEGFQQGVPVACSNVTSLPQQAGDAAIIFDPNSPREIANSILRLVKDEDLKQKIVEKGKERIRKYSWEKTGKIFRAHYRRIAKLPLSVTDSNLLRSPVSF